MKITPTNLQENTLDTYMVLSNSYIELAPASPNTFSEERCAKCPAERGSLDATTTKASGLSNVSGCFLFVSECFLTILW